MCSALRPEINPLTTTLTNLTELFLDNTPLNDEGLAKLTPLSLLGRLSVIGTPVTPAGIAAFKQANPDCRVITK